MRKILFLMAMLVCSLQFAMAGDVVTRDVNKLPVAAREMIGKHFSQTKVAYIKIEKDLFQTTSYGSPDKPGGLSIQLCKSEKKEFYIRYSS